MLRILPFYIPVLFFRPLWDALVTGEGLGDILSLSFVWHHMYFKVWYVPYQSFLYILTPVYLGFFCKNPKKVTIISIPIVFIFSLLAGWGRSSLFIAVARIPVFLIGFYLAWCNENETYDHQVLAGLYQKGIKKCIWFVKKKINYKNLFTVSKEN